NSDIKILLVEDDIFSRNLIIVKLNKQNLKCDIAVNGKEAVNAVLLKKYDIILMDCQMPVMDGYTATKKIRELDNGKKTPIIAMTAHAMAGDREKCIESGMDDYVSKPVNLKILFDLIRKYSS
ncbi:MAG: response regulator, partial [Candidatus Muiribacteriota bacterium]